MKYILLTISLTASAQEIYDPKQSEIERMCYEKQSLQKPAEVIARRKCGHNIDCILEVLELAGIPAKCAELFND